MKWIGMSRKRWLQTLIILIFVFSLFYQVWWLALTCLAVLVVLNFVYRWGRRRGYTLFVEKEAPIEPWIGEGFSEANKLQLRSTGHFLVGEKEHRLILVSSECWQLPIGEIVLMLEVAPGRFAYQFIDLNAVEQVRFGELWFGNRYEIAIEIVFQTDWIQADDQMSFGWQKVSDKNKKVDQRVVTLSFNNLDDAHQVWGQFK